MIVAAFLLAAQATAQPVPATPPAPAATAPSEKKVCRREDSLGTILSKRVCRTAAEWSAIDTQNARNAERFGANRNNGQGVGRVGD